MKRSLVLALCIASAVLSANAQNFATRAKASSIAGTVVKQVDSQPLKKVLVQVIAEDQKHGGNYTATTDADGHFRVDDIVPGRYRLFFERSGFAGVNGRGLKSDVNVFAIQAGQSLDDLVFRMLPTAVISGRITDEDGDPLSEVRVIAQQRRPGKPTREVASTSATNDLGEYRLSGLFPGEYWVVALPPPDFRDYEARQEATPPSAGDKNDDKNHNKNESQTDTRYLATYYPGTFDAAQASPVTLKAGDEMPVSFTLVPGRTYRVRGIFAGFPAGQKPVVEVLSKTGDIIRTSEVASDGQFDVGGVGPGSYVLTASAGTDLQPLTAHQDINIVTADVEGVKLVPSPSFTLSGHLRVEGPGAGELPQCSVNLGPGPLSDDPDSVLFQEFFGTNAPVDRLGNFEWKKVNPGNYIVQLFGAEAHSNFYLKSVTLGGRDVTTGFAASGPATLDLVVSTKGGTIEGAVIEKEKDADDGHPASDAAVVAVPEERFRKLPDRFGTAATDQQGRFMIRGLAPGHYTLYAWRDLADGVWYEAGFLKSQEANGTPLGVEEDSHQKVELKLSPVSEEWR
jgi:protocatechuate 3,4-dioxygenase beta subunit